MDWRQAKMVLRKTETNLSKSMDVNSNEEAAKKLLISYFAAFFISNYIC